MTMPAKAIDRIFMRLGATYGAAWDRSLGSTPVNDAKSAWQHELQGFAGHLEAVAWALENLPERCPNVIEFRNLCRRAPMPDVPRLPEPKADPQRLQQELSKLGELRKQVASSTGYDHKGWARRILGRYEGGDKINPTTLRFAREALRMQPSGEGEA